MPYLLTARAWSPTALQQYARCPYRFALRGIFGLRPVERPIAIERVDPATRGQIYHEVQFELLRDLTARHQLPVTSENLPLALELLEQALQLVARQAEADLAPAIPQIWHAEVDAIRADLRGWLQRGSQQSGWTPEFFELSFGLRDPAGRDPRSQPEPVELDGGFRLQGSIDLVERHASGRARSGSQDRSVRIPGRRWWGGRGAAAGALCARGGEAARRAGECGRLYYATIAQNYTAIECP